MILGATVQHFVMIPLFYSISLFIGLIEVIADAGISSVDLAFKVKFDATQVMVDWV